MGCGQCLKFTFSALVGPGRVYRIEDEGVDSALGVLGLMGTCIYIYIHTHLCLHFCWGVDGIQIPSHPLLTIGLCIKTNKKETLWEVCEVLLLARFMLM